ncbi:MULTISPECIES: YggT family protein [Cellulomonas]|uniref:YggT family protein n=1 Tax=Cellulomonas iranensis TaxID=76862 RepID=A0ABU0GFN1_9CELL|nr:MULTISPECIES: YggT family protein [Cellulomonas]MBO9569548.1 YggT family protein [Cellulomonas iranensis]MDQ0423744.1 YggT family protein [Cellulomonas iranensis]TFH72582.1 YggT family protein [Cellulomonas sp. HD19AZ1]UCN13317.1 YggT family protein [Cellulomonas iranensis]
MRIFANLLYLVVLVFFLLLLVRLVLDWVQVFAREWRPTGFVLVVAEVAYSVTDPPLRALRRVLPPIGIGSVRLDLAFLVLALGCTFLMSLLASV